MKKKSQIFSIDLMAAILIFIFVINFAYVLHSDYMNEASEKQSNNIIKIRGLQISDLLIKSKGVPVDWNTTDVQQIGLVYDDFIFNPRKLSDFYDMMEGNYDTTKNLIGTEANHLEFILFDPKTDRKIFLEELGDIAYTEGPGGNPDEPNETMFGLRSWLQRNNISYYDYERRWQDLIAEIDNYDVIIMEDPQLDACTIPGSCAADEINETHEQALKVWLLAGGLIIDKEEGDWITIFNMSMHTKWTNENCTSDPSWATNGTVVAINDLMNNSINLGDQICFDEAPGVYNDTDDNLLYRFVQIDDPAITFGSYAGVGYWYYGEGKIIYLSDTFGMAPGLGNNVRETINIFKEIDLGQKPTTYDDIFSHQRYGVIGNRTIGMRLLLWN